MRRLLVRKETHLMPNYLLIKHSNTMKTLIKYTSLLLLILVSVNLFSQSKWSIEFRPTINFPTADLDDSKVGTGYGFELTGAYKFMEHLDGYAGWSFNSFTVDDSNVDLDETGYSFGLLFIHPLGTSESLSYLLRAGATYNHIEIEDAQGDIVADSGHGFGYQIEIGVNYRFGNQWDLRPTIRYRALSRDLDIDNESIKIDLNYLSFGLGIAKSF